MPGRRYTPATIRWILSNRKILLVGPMVLFGLISTLVTYTLKDQYRASTLILVVPQRVPENYVRPAVAETIEQRLQSISPQIMSESRLQRIITELDLYPDKRNKRGGMEEIVADLRSDISVDIIKGDLFRVTYGGTNPYKVMQVTQRLASLFVEENLKDRANLAEGTNRFLESQLDNTRRSLEEQERKLREYRQTHAGELPSQVGANLQVLQNSAFQLQSGEESLSRDRDRRLELQRALAELRHEAEAAKAAAPPAPPAPPPTEPPTETASGDSVPPPARLGSPADAATKLAQLQALQRQLAALELRLKPEHPDVIRMRRLIADLEKSIGAMGDPALGDGPIDAQSAVRNARIEQVRAQLGNLDAEIVRKTAAQEKLKAQIATLQQRVENEPTRESELIGLTRDYDTLRATYQGLLAKKEESGIAADLERQQVGQQFKTLDPVRLPEKPYGPPRMMINLIAAGVGLGLGLAFTVLLEVRDQTFRNALEIVPVLSLPVLASVPAVLTTTERRKARRLTLAIVTLLVSSVGTGGMIAYKMGLVDITPFKFW
jgi:polysaccharide chain length determinant protein (PEP-CTERM system associated)